MISSHRPALKAPRRCIRPLTVVSIQNDPGALKRRLTTRRTALSTWPEPMGSLRLSSVTYRMRCACRKAKKLERANSSKVTHPPPFRSRLVFGPSPSCHPGKWLPNDIDQVRRKLTISAHESHLFGLGLRNEQPIKRIMVMQRELL